MRTLMAVALTLAVSTIGASAFDTSELGQAGSLFLDDITALIDKSPKLKAEVAAALAKVDKTPDKIICLGMRFPGPWKELGGARVAPYTCEIGDQELEIRARVRLTGRNGKVYEKVTGEAMKRAETVTEDKLVWTWKKAEPQEKKDEKK